MTRWRRVSIRVRVDEEAVELQDGVDGQRLAGDDPEHPAAQAVELVDADHPEREGDVQGARELL